MSVYTVCCLAGLKLSYDMHAVHAVRWPYWQQTSCHRPASCPCMKQVTNWKDTGVERLPLLFFCFRFCGGSSFKEMKWHRSRVPGATWWEVWKHCDAAQKGNFCSVEGGGKEFFVACELWWSLCFYITFHLLAQMSGRDNSQRAQNGKFVEYVLENWHPTLPVVSLIH